MNHAKHLSLFAASNHKTMCVIVFFILLLSNSGFSAITVTAPAAKDTVKACPDYANEVLLERWDMNERTDIAWKNLNTVEFPTSNLTDILFNNGIFSAISVYTPGGKPNYSGININIIEPAYLGSAMLGKVGKNFPINADKYSLLTLRMYLEVEREIEVGQLLWSKNTDYSNITTAGDFHVYSGWFIYMIDIPSLDILYGPEQWTGLIDSLRIDPHVWKDMVIKIDWIRLVEDDPTYAREIIWTGNTTNVDIYLDSDNNADNGNLGKLAKDTPGTSYSFQAGALFPGDYYVAVAPTGTTDYAYSSGYYHINDTPILNFTKPTAEGSDDDFITTNFSDPWDMSNSEDVEHTERLSNTNFLSIDFEDHAGNLYTNQPVYYGESLPAVAPNVGDPNVFFFHFHHRAAQTSIDTAKYHNLVFNMGIQGAQSSYDGSIARVMWRVKGESVENVSQDIIIRHHEDNWVMSKIVCDLRTLPLEEGAASPSHTGWTGEIDAFRIDPHEFSDPRAFFFDNVRITSDWTVKNSFTIEWNATDSDSSPLVSLYYDTNNSGYDGTLIAANLAAGAATLNLEEDVSASSSGSYVWDVSALPEGKYWIYADISDGINSNRTYTTGPLIIDRALIPVIELSKTSLVFGAERSGFQTDEERIIISNAGEGALNWQVTANNDWIDVHPSSGSGNGEFYVGIAHTNLFAGTTTGTVTITDTKASNSPQTINVTLTVYRFEESSPPFGVFDTPVNGTTGITGAIPVTGWALDDVGVASVKIYREPVAGEATDELIYVGDAGFVEGARQDIESAYPTYPANSRAGWGYMMLTNFLPGQGNGTFYIHALLTDKEGNEISLGQKTITCDNANAVKPFGTIDTPQQGEEISGLIWNQGWALTPLSNTIPTDGSTINVWIDGKKVGKPDYNQYRNDIATLFPGYNNTAGAACAFLLDTSLYVNGVHTIAWSVQDNAGNSDGIGSRFFSVQNLSGSINSFPTGLSQKPNMGVDESLKIAVDPESGTPETAGENKIVIEQLERIELHLRSKEGLLFRGWGRDRSKGLPAGSTLDREKGIFYWMPGPGFLGTHTLHFAVTDGVNMGNPITIQVYIVPKTYEKVSKKQKHIFR